MTYYNQDTQNASDPESHRSEPTHSRRLRHATSSGTLDVDLGPAPQSDKTDRELRADGGIVDTPEVTDEEESLPSLEDLTAFQRHLLAVLADGPDYGLGIKRKLEAWSGEGLNHGRLYPNLDTLVEEGLVEKSELDKRTNEYKLSEKGTATHNQYLDDLHAVSDGAVPERGGDD